MATDTRTKQQSQSGDVLTLAAERAQRYVRAAAQRRVAPSEAAVAALGEIAVRDDVGGRDQFVASVFGAQDLKAFLGSSTPLTDVMAYLTRDLAPVSMVGSTKAPP